MFGALLLLVVFAAIGYVTYCYITAPTTMVVSNGILPEDKPVTRPATTMDRLSYATKRSATLFVAAAQAGVIMLFNGIMSMADFFGSPELRMFINEHFSAEYASAAALFCLALVCWARARNALGV